MSKGTQERAGGADMAAAAFIPTLSMLEGVGGGGVYHVDYTEPPADREAEFMALREQLLRDQAAPWWNLFALLRVPRLQARLAAIPQELVWTDRIENVWCLQGMEAVLTHALKGSSYTSTVFLGLIESTGYGFAGANGTGVTKGALAGSITAAGGASPANGWNEAPSSVVATRGTPSFGTASSSGTNSDLVTSTVAFSTLATATIKGTFLIMKDKAGTAASATVGNANGAILSCGLFTGGDNGVSASGTLNVTYTARLTTT